MQIAEVRLVGTTLLAAHQLGRIGYGVDIDPGYVAVALERMSQLGLKPALANSLAQSAQIAGRDQ